MESSLHHRLKEIHGIESGGRCEVAVDGFRIDAVAGDGSLVEIQSGALGPLKPKLRSLLPHHRIRVVKPIVTRRWIVRRATADGPDLSRRHSPRRKELIDAFDDLVGLAAFLPDRNLTVELIGACVSCPASTVTLKAGLERILKDRVPGVTEVIDAGAAKAEIGETPVSL